MSFSTVSNETMIHHQTREELCPTDGELVNRIRSWIKEKFGSPARNPSEPHRVNVCKKFGRIRNVKQVMAVFC